ncbi:MAG: signal peptidase I [Clostridiales bacterium]|nr:signal peptidase I [Clostridiales bacterium]
MFPLNWKAIKEWVVLFVIAITIAMFLRTFIVEPRYVPTPSMVPTIRVDDRLYVEKLTPRFGTLQRGMIVTFLAPEQTGRDDYLVKRLIGLGGDVISIINGQLYVNGQAVYEPYLNGPMLSDYPETTVPEGKLFLMGDNRNHSQDSRAWGSIEVSCVKGQALFIYFPFGHIGSLWNQSMQFTEG